VRGQLVFGLAHGATVRGRSYLALGSFSTISSTLASVFSRRPAFGWVDAPAPGAAVTRGSTVSVAGWALAPEDLATVTVELDGTQVATLPVNGSRPDVCAVYPDYAGCPQVGFTGSVSLAGLDACVHVLRVVATTTSGVRTVLGERLVQR
jgi:hypothetical protein